jgi:hypothetical protein
LQQSVIDSSLPAKSERTVLLLCARTSLDAAQAARLRDLLRQPLEWARAVSAADRHGLLPLLYTHLKAHAADLTPAPWLDFLEQRFHENHRNAMYLAGILVKVLALFESEGIAAIPYKGPVLAQELYGNLALRPFGDLDILLRHRDIPRAASLLTARGFVPEPGSAVPAGQDSSPETLDAAGQFGFLADDGAALVELHSELTLRHFPRSPDPERFLANPATVNVAGRSIPTLRPAALLLFLCVHGAKDFWGRVKWISDIAEFLRVHQTLDWADVRAQARSLGCERMLNLGLILARDLLGCALPEPLQLACEADREAGRLAARLAQGLFDETDSMTAFGRFLFRVRMHPRRWQGLGYALRLTVTPAEEDRALTALPRSFAPAYALLRPFRLLHKYGIGRRRSGPPPS